MHDPFAHFYKIDISKNRINSQTQGSATKKINKTVMYNVNRTCTFYLLIRLTNEPKFDTSMVILSVKCYGKRKRNVLDVTICLSVLIEINIFSFFFILVFNGKAIAFGKENDEHNYHEDETGRKTLVVTLNFHNLLQLFTNLLFYVIC